MSDSEFGLVVSDKTLSFAALVLGLTAASLGLYYSLNWTPKPPFPPGPKGWPVIGNALNMPQEHSWLAFAQWATLYGDVVSVNIFGRRLVIINSVKAATDLMEHRASIYSNRPRLVMGELIGWSERFIFLPYNESYLKMRKILHSEIGTKRSVSQFHTIQEEEARKYLWRALINHDDIPTNLRKTAGSLILRATYGYRIQEENDPLINLADRALAQFDIIAKPGAFLVDFIPALRYIPSWFPGAGFKHLIKKWRNEVTEMGEAPIRFVRAQLAVGKAEPSLAAKHLDFASLTDVDIHTVTIAAAAMYAGGSATTVSVLSSLYLALLLHPEIQRRAQAEIDAVCNGKRLPCFSDRDKLPYINAICKEIQRWNPAGPLAIAHKSIQDDVYNGYHIPKGSSVIVNAWSLLHDPELYPEPMAFNPDRFIPTERKEPEPDPQKYAFGFGRRVCPGMHFADASIFITAAMSLAVFDVSKPVVNGVSVEPVVDYTSGVISQPKGFECHVAPRSTDAKALILSAFETI